MKAIINGKRYDTDKAALIASDGSAGLSRSDFQWWEEDLYLTKNGSWFVAGTGGALTKYAKPVGSNGTSGGERIIPLTAEEARDWLENSENYNSLEYHFGDTIVDA